MCYPMRRILLGDLLKNKNTQKNILITLCVCVFFFSCVKSECPFPEKKQSSITALNKVNNVKLIVIDGGRLTEDAFISIYYPNINYGLDFKNYCTAWTYSGVPAEGFFLLKFKFEDLVTNQKIISARLTLFADTSNVFSGSPMPDRSHYGVNLDLVIKNMNSSWDESLITFNNKPSTSNLNVMRIGAPLSLTSSCVDIDVTKLVQSQKETGNFGFEIRLENPIIYKRVAFYSKDSPNASFRPKLEIVYQ